MCSCQRLIFTCKVLQTSQLNWRVHFECISKSDITKAFIGTDPQARTEILEVSFLFTLTMNKVTSSGRLLESTMEVEAPRSLLVEAEVECGETLNDGLTISTAIQCYWCVCVCVSMGMCTYVCVGTCVC